MPAFDRANFNYSFTADDVRFSRLLEARFSEFVTSGAIGAWKRFSSGAGVLVKDELPSTGYAAIDLALPDRVVEGFRSKECAFWLGQGFYETKGLIN